MTEKYILNGDTLPTIPIPQNCFIKALDFDSEYFTMIFGSGVSDPNFKDEKINFDSVKQIRFNASSLKIRFHLLNPVFDAYEHKLNIGLSGGEGLVLLKNKKLRKLQQLEYLSHYLGYKSAIVKLFKGTSFILHFETDLIEFEWNK